VSSQAMIGKTAAIKMLELAVDNVADYLDDEPVTLHLLGGMLTGEMLKAITLVHGGGAEELPSLEAQLSDGITDGLNEYTRRFGASSPPELDCYSRRLH